MSTEQGYDSLYQDASTRPTPHPAEVYVRVPDAWRAVCQAVSRGEYVALVGARGCGKTLLLQDVLATLRGGEHPDPAEGSCACVYVDLDPWRVYHAAGLFGQLAAAIHAAIPDNERLPLPLLPADVDSSQSFRRYLAGLLAALPESLVLALDHIESLPPYLAKALLRCLRVVYSERDVHPEYGRLVVVAAGALNLFQLTTSRISPFNIATLVSIPDADEGQSRALIAQLSARLGVQLSARAVQRILEAAEGDRYLAAQLCRLVAGQPKGVRPRVTVRAVERALTQLESCEPLQDPCLAERIRLVERDPGILKTVLEVLAGHEIRRRELLTDVDQAELTGAVKVVRHRYAVRNSLCGRLLRCHFTPRRVARLFSAFGRWDEAIRYFEQSDPAASTAERAEYLAAVVNRIYGDGDEEMAFQSVAEALCNGFGVRQFFLHRYLQDGHKLLPVAWRGFTGDLDLTEVLPEERSEQPQARAYYADDYLLERDGAGNSLLAFPLPSGGPLPPVGLLTLYNHFPVEEFVRHREEVIELTGFVSQVGRAIASQREKQELLQRERRRVEMLTGLGNVTKAITSLRELESLLALVVTDARLVLGADVVTLYLYDAGQQRFHTPIAVGLRDEDGFRRLPMPRIAGQIAGQIVRSGRSLLFENVAEHPAAAKSAFVQREAIRAIAGFPLLYAGAATGVMFVGHRMLHTFSPDEEQIAAVFADHAAIAIRNAQLYHRLAVDNATLASLYQVSTALRASLDPAEVLDLVTTSLQARFGLATCTVGLLDSTEQHLEFVAHLGLPQPTARRVEDLPAGLWRTVREAKRPLFVPDLAAQPDLARQLERADLHSFIALPLQGSERFLGVLTMGSTKPLQLDEAGWELITALADQAAVAIENAQLHERIRQANKDLDDSLKILTHQLRAAPAFVTNTLSTMLAGKLGTLDDRQQDRLAKAQRRLDQHHRLIDSLNMYGRLKGGRIVPQKSPVQLAGLLHEVAAEYAARARRQGLAFHLQCDSLPQVTVDEGLIRIVIVNLLDNAFKFTQPGGRVCLEAWPEAGGIALAVDDSGPGIPVEDRQRVFLEYHQLQAADAEKGVGLGLYIAWRLVQLHAGRIAVVDKKGPGTRMQVYLPAGC